MKQLISIFFTLICLFRSVEGVHIIQLHFQPSSELATVVSQPLGLEENAMLYFEVVPFIDTTRHLIDWAWHLSIDHTKLPSWCTYLPPKRTPEWRNRFALKLGPRPIEVANATIELHFTAGAGFVDQTTKTFGEMLQTLTLMMHVHLPIPAISLTPPHANDTPTTTTTTTTRPTITTNEPMIMLEEQSGYFHFLPLLPITIGCVIVLFFLRSRTRRKKRIFRGRL